MDSKQKDLAISNSTIKTPPKTPIETLESSAQTSTYSNQTQINCHDFATCSSKSESLDSSPIKSKIVEKAKNSNQVAKELDSTKEISQAKLPHLWRVVFLSVLYSGKSPKAPGTAGSALSVLLGLPILLYSAQTLFLLACLLGVIAVREIDKWEAYSKKHDEKWIVIDELVGVWLAMSIVCYGGYFLGLTAHIVLAFVLFRVFDIWKPSIIGRIDRGVKGGLGVVLDDVAAGIVAGIAGILVLFAYDAAFGIVATQAH